MQKYNFFVRAGHQSCGPQFDMKSVEMRNSVENDIFGGGLPTKVLIELTAASVRIRNGALAVT